MSDREIIPAGKPNEPPLALKGPVERRRAILRNAPDAFLETDVKGFITAWNSSAEALFGWPQSQALGRKFSQEIVAPACRKEYEKAAGKLLDLQGKKARNLRLETTALHKNGREFPLELAARSLQQDEAVYLAAFARELTREKPLEEEAERRHRAIMDQLGETYTETDLQGKTLYVSKRYFDLFNLSSAERPPSATYRDVFQPEVSRLLTETYYAVYRSGEPARIEFESGQINECTNMRLEASISLKKDFRGRVTGFMNITHDCTRRRMAGQEMIKAKEAAEAASRAKGEFLANMSHEIRTPLNGVLGMLDLASYTQLTVEQRELLEMAQSAGGSLLAVINDILDFSKIEAGNLNFNCVDFDLNEALLDALATMAVIARKKGLVLRHDVLPGVPWLYRGDPVRLKQVLINLLGNAVKFTETGSVALIAKCLEINGAKARLQFSVADTGIGIPVEKQKMIFEAFSQADASTTRKFGGTGLGLAIGARIVQLMGGKIWVESEIGRGSVFHFTVVLDMLQTGHSGLKAGHMVAPSQQAMEKFTILLAEDNAVNQKLAVGLLERFGHRVVVANNGREALLKLEQQDFDLILMDVQMPEMDGFTATAAIRCLEDSGKANLPIVALTAHAMKEDRERCLAAGMDDYLAKPIHPGELRETVAKAVSAKRRHRAINM